jgi:quercetin dioxygenase-like cupin family protein
MAKTKSKRRASAPTTAKRKTAPRARAKTTARSAPQQKFTVSHHREEDFKDGGLRSHATYRDLGISAATHGMVHAHVIRHVRPAAQEGAGKLHYHDVQFQMIYVLKGWLTTEFEGEGAFTMREGTCWLQPPRIVHAVREYSDDCELLEIILPAEFETVTLE